MKNHHLRCSVEYQTIFGSIFTLEIPSSLTPIHWNISNAVMLMVGCNKKIRVIKETTIFLLKSVNFFGNVRWRRENIITTPMKSTTGNIAMEKALRNKEEGVNNLRSACLLNQSNETKAPELDPTLSIGRNMLERIFGNFMP